MPMAEIESSRRYHIENAQEWAFFLYRLPAEQSLFHLKNMRLLHFYCIIFY